MKKFKNLELMVNTTLHDVIREYHPKYPSNVFMTYLKAWNKVSLLPDSLVNDNVDKIAMYSLMLTRRYHRRYEEHYKNVE